MLCTLDLTIEWILPFYSTVFYVAYMYVNITYLDITTIPIIEVMISVSILYMECIIYRHIAFKRMYLHYNRCISKNMYTHI